MCYKPAPKMLTVLGFLVACSTTQVSDVADKESTPHGVRYRLEGVIIPRDMPLDDFRVVKRLVGENLGGDEVFLKIIAGYDVSLYNKILSSSEPTPANPSDRVLVSTCLGELCDEGYFYHVWRINGSWRIVATNHYFV